LNIVLLAKGIAY